MNGLLEFIRDNILGGFEISLDYNKCKSELCTDYSVKECGNTVELSYDLEEMRYARRLKLLARCMDDTVIFYLDSEAELSIHGLLSYKPENALNMKLGGGIKPDCLLGSAHYQGMWWMFPTFAENYEELAPLTQSLLAKYSDRHYHILPLCGENFRCELDGSGLHINTGMSGVRSLKGAFLAVSAADDPYTAVCQAYTNARAAGAIDVPLRTEREMPLFARGLGWCTWETCRQDVNAEKIFKKLDEFKAQNIPLKWVMIDDGWFMQENMMLTSFEEDKTKFPEGLKACISKMKKDYGVEQVGVWHAYTAGWYGVKPGSKLYEEEKDNLFTTPSGMVLPSLDEEKAFAFWDRWYTYLKSCGVDMLKVDNQSSISPRLEGVLPTVQGARVSHRAIERAVIKHFGNNMINCMGMDMENVFARPFTGLSRNSDDFDANNKRMLIKHILQNSYNAIFHSPMYHCDFDMWWSKEKYAVQSGLLRAISGSPNYISDAMGETTAQMIHPTLDEDGSVLMCDNAGQVTLDCYYVDCRKESKLQKLWNRSGECFAAAAFNISEECICDRLVLASIPGISSLCEYVAYEYFTKKFHRVSAADSIELELEADGCAAFSVYPIEKDADGEYILLGSTEKYIGIASAYKKKTRLESLAL